MIATRDIAIALPSVCLSVTLRYCVKTAKRVGEILQTPDSSIGQLTKHRYDIRTESFKIQEDYENCAVNKPLYLEACSHNA